MFRRGDKVRVRTQWNYRVRNKVHGRVTSVRGDHVRVRWESGLLAGLLEWVHARFLTPVSVVEMVGELGADRTAIDRSSE